MKIFTIVVRYDDAIEEEDITKAIKNTMKEKWKDSVFIHEIEPNRPRPIR